MHLIKKRKEKTMVCAILVLGLGSRQPVSRGPWRFCRDYFKSTLQSQANESHVFIHQGYLFLRDILFTVL